MITIIPAIDIKDGKCVRLRQGRMDDSTVYSEDPVEMAKRWAAEGAGYLHVVDLDGAIQGKPVHTEVIGRIAASVKIPVEAGGGLREDKDIEALLNAGIRRAIIGTRAFGDAAALNGVIRRFGGRIAVGIDARDGMVQIKGWVETTGMKAAELAAQVDMMRVKTIIYTDTSVDGMLSGINAAVMGEICDKVRCNVIASGGIASASDVNALRSLNRRNLVGAIVGRALYEKRVTLQELIAAARNEVNRT
jgi:phosphoribosylformimino-5-aminoimidazole carboxamide ribotide isomerase